MDSQPRKRKIYREMRETMTLRHFEEFKKMLMVSILFTVAINAII
jgi:hypothetical protein